MSRRSKLGVVARMARLDEQEKLRELSLARGATSRHELATAALTLRIADATRISVPEPGASTNAATLVDARSHLTALKFGEQAVAVELAAARGVEHAAIEALTQSKRRVKAIDNAIERRAQRERRAARRREQRIADDLARESGEADHATPA